MPQNIKYRLIILTVILIFPAFCFAGDVYQSVFCTETEADQLAADFSLGVSENIEPSDFFQYNECLDGKLYKKGGDYYEFYYSDPTKVCDDLCNNWLTASFTCTFDSCEPDDPPVDTIDPVYVHLAGLAGCLLGFLFGLAFILGSYIH